MHSVLFGIFGALSLLTTVIFLVLALQRQHSGKNTEKVLTPTHLFTGGVFLAVLLIFIPIYYTSYDFADENLYFRPLLLAIHNSLRVFILDGDFETVVNAEEVMGDFLWVAFSLYAAMLYVVAPVLTFGNVLLLFKNLKGEARYHRNRKKTHYIFSELNTKSMALARSLRKEDKKAVIVFTEVFAKNEERDHELLAQARELNAICLNRDISYLDIAEKKGPVELFLIGENEAENVSQAVKITTELNQRNEKQNVKVFVFSQSPSSAYILDSLRYDNLLKYAADHSYDASTFRLRRIHEQQRLIWKTMPQMKLFELAQNNDKKLSVLIAGFGSYGVEFFKTLIWYCQFEGYQLQINIVDKEKSQTGEKSKVRALVDRMCPELMKTNRLEMVGEAHYDIEIIPGVDLERSDFADLLNYEGDDPEKQKWAQRLRQTNLALVALGDDDRNIESAVYLRSLFDQIRPIRANENTCWEDELVQLYAVVYDDQKASILHQKAQDKDYTLVNHKDVPYHIHFIGDLSTQFDYKNIYDAKLEEEAYAHHIGWVAIEEKIRQETQQPGSDYTPDLKQEKMNYERFEYFRNSSIAKQLYKKAVEKNKKLLPLTICLEGQDMQTCQCDNCVRRKRSEHMRWNAYSRVMGLEYHADVKDSRARLHLDLKAWGLLSEFDQMKD